MTDPANNDIEVEAVVVDARDMAFWLLIRKDGTADIKANCSPEQAVAWLEEITQGIKDRQIAPKEEHDGTTGMEVGAEASPVAPSPSDGEG